MTRHVTCLSTDINRPSQGWLLPALRSKTRFSVPPTIGRFEGRFFRLFLEGKSADEKPNFCKLQPLVVICVYWFICWKFFWYFQYLEPMLSHNTKCFMDRLTLALCTRNITALVVSNSHWFQSTCHWEDLPTLHDKPPKLPKFPDPSARPAKHY